MLSTEGGAGGHCLSILRSCLLPLTSSNLPILGAANPNRVHSCSRPRPSPAPASGEAVSAPSISGHGSHRGPGMVLPPGRGLEASRRHSKWSFPGTVRKNSLPCNAGQNVSACVLSRFSHARFFAVPWTTAHQVPLSMGSSRQEYWSGSPCPPPGDLPNPETELASLRSTALAGGFFTTSATWEAPTDQNT